MNDYRRFLTFVFLLMISGSAALAQELMKVAGLVVDQNADPLIGVTVRVQGDNKGGAVTDMDGNFTIQVQKGKTLVFSYLGYKNKEVLANSSKLKITLHEDNKVLDDVVVVGYGVQKKSSVTGAISQVKKEDMENRTITNAKSALQGKTAGVQIVSSSARPGASPTVRIRGFSSNGSSDPLYVVDGVPMTNIDFLAADDIDNIQVLKDASSAAIYGSRAANGVIIIGTKQGKAGVAKVSLNAHYAFNTVRDNQESLNAAQYKELMDEIGLVKLPEGLKDQTDWKDEVFRTGNVQDYQLSITNGTDKLRYFISGGYTGENGVIKKSSYQRYNFRASVENDIRKWLRLNASVTYSDYTNKGTGIISGAGSNRGGVVTAIVNTPTYAPVWNPENPSQFYNNFYGVNITSPAENIARTQNNKSAYNRLLATGKATVTFMPELTYNTSLSFDRTQGTTTNFLDPISTTIGRQEFGTGYDGRNISSVIVWDNVLNYKKAFGKHSLDAMAGSSWTQSKWSQNYINGSNYANDLFNLECSQQDFLDRNRFVSF